MMGTLEEKALQYFGIKHQLRKLQEECGECIQAVNKYIIGEYGQVKLLEELADVSNLLDQMRCYFGSDLEARCSDKKSNFEKRLLEKASKIPCERCKGSRTIHVTTWLDDADYRFDRIPCPFCSKIVS